MSFNEALSKLIVGEICLNDTEAEKENALFVHAKNTTRKYHSCRTKGHVVQDCWSKKKSSQDDQAKSKDK